MLVLVAPTERRMRIEVGYGLEGVIPDGLAGAIIRDDFTPEFSKGNFESGILTGVRRVAAVVRAKQVLTPEQLAALQSSSSSRPGVFLWIVFAIVGAMWLAGVVMAGTMFGQALNVRSGSNLVFGMFAVAIFAGLPMYALGADSLRAGAGRAGRLRLGLPPSSAGRRETPQRVVIRVGLERLHGS